MRRGGRMVVHGTRLDHAEHAVVQDDIAQGEQERRPVLVEDEDRDDDEKWK